MDKKPKNNHILARGLKISEMLVEYELYTQRSKVTSTLVDLVVGKIGIRNENQNKIRKDKNKDVVQTGRLAFRNRKKWSN